MQGYDRLEYPSFPLPQAHPNRLATMARVFGLSSPPVDSCTVLELGCGDGSHLLACAAGLPGSRFVGLDLAAAPIERARGAAQALGLANVQFSCGDLLAFSPPEETFDYIIAHGLYTWVPAAVRDGILELIRSRLAPSGVAYVSYNTYPGCYVRRMVWEMMRFHVRDLEDPEQQINQSAALLRFLTEGNPRSDGLHQLLLAEMERVQSRAGRALLYFDDLEEHNAPVYFHEFVRHARAYGLQFLAETDFYEMQFSIYPPLVTDQLQELARHDYVLKEQYLDFLKCRRFRQTLLCRDDIRLQRELDSSAARHFRMLSVTRPASASLNLQPGVVEDFQGPRGAAIKLDHAVSKAALCCLAEAHPRSLSFDEMLAQARRLLAERQIVSSVPAEDEEQALAEVMLAAFSADLVRWQLFEHDWDTTLADRPRLTRLARWQLERGDRGLTMPNLARLQFESDWQRETLRLADGTRSVEQICSQISDEMQKANIALPDGGQLHAVLRKAAHYGLLEGHGDD